MKPVDRSCLSYWFPLVEAAGLPVPKTVIVRAPDLSSWGDLRRGQSVAAGFEGFFAELEAAVRKIGGCPIFLRTGLGSGKHGWADTCWVPNEQALPDHAFAIWEWSETVDMFGLATDVWAVRELLETEPIFLAFGGRFPVTKERRYFVRDGVVICKHPYWPEGAIEEGRPRMLSRPLQIDLPVNDWREQLAAMNVETPGEAETLWTLASRVAAVVPGFWSVDFLWTKNRGWVLIDMAAGERSFHWNGCSDGPIYCTHRGKVFHKFGCECRRTNFIGGHVRCERDCWPGESA